MIELYLLWIIIHYIIAYSYVNWCTIDDVIMSDDKQCVRLHWIVYNEIGALITLSASIIILVYIRWRYT